MLLRLFVLRFARETLSGTTTRVLNMTVSPYWLSGQKLRPRMSAAIFGVLKMRFESDSTLYMSASAAGAMNVQ
jgi:hypothetical protein